jgi:hypothetical protein
MRDRIVRSPYPEEVPTEPRRAQETEDDPREPDPFDDDVDEDAIALP